MIAELTRDQSREPGSIVARGKRDWTRSTFLALDRLVNHSCRVTTGRARSFAPWTEIGEPESPETTSRAGPRGFARSVPHVCHRCKSPSQAATWVGLGRQISSLRKKPRQDP